MRARKAITLALFLTSLSFISNYANAESVLTPPAGGSMYLGAYVDYLSGDAQSLTNNVATFEGTTGKSLAWNIILNEWGSNLQFPWYESYAAYNAGSTPLIRVLPRSVDYETDAVDPILRLDYMNRGDFDAQIKQWADVAKQLPFPVLVEFAPEANGNWYQWSGTFYDNGPALYQAVYQRFINICRQEGATNITWVFHMNNLSNPATANNTMAQYYPGDSYIDWLGISVVGALYQTDYWDNFTDLLDPGYTEMAAVSTTKPIAIVEASVIESLQDPNKKAGWITDAYNAMKSGSYPRIKAFSFWSEPSWTTEGNDLRVDSSPQTLAAARAMFLDQMFITGTAWSTRH